MSKLHLVGRYTKASMTIKMDPRSRILRPSKDELIEKLFRMMYERQLRIGDWELREFTQDHPDCVRWKHPQKEMVPLLYAFYLGSRWLVRHFIQMDPTKIHETDKHGKDATLIASLAGQRGMAAYARAMMEDDPPDVYENPIRLEDPLKGIPRGVENLLKRHRRLREILAEQAKEKEERENNKNANVVFVSLGPSMDNEPN